MKLWIPTLDEYYIVTEDFQLKISKEGYRSYKFEPIKQGNTYVIPKDCIIQIKSMRYGDGSINIKGGPLKKMISRANISMSDLNGMKIEKYDYQPQAKRKQSLINWD